MSSEPRTMKEIHDIRLKIHKEIKGLSPEQRSERTRRAVKEMEEKCDVKFRRPEPSLVRKSRSFNQGS
jgi:hypothetical protein